MCGGADYDPIVAAAAADSIVEHSWTKPLAGCAPFSLFSILLNEEAIKKEAEQSNLGEVECSEVRKLNDAKS